MSEAVIASVTAMMTVTTATAGTAATGIAIIEIPRQTVLSRIIIVPICFAVVISATCYSPVTVTRTATVSVKTATVTGIAAATVTRITSTAVSPVVAATARGPAIKQIQQTATANITKITHTYIISFFVKYEQRFSPLPYIL